MSEFACTTCGRPLALTDRICPNCRRLAVLCGRYLMQPHRAGVGGYATVYEATDIMLGRRCAIKMIPYRPGELERVEREVHALIHLSEAGLSFVPIVYDVDREEPEHFYIVMEFISGPTLAQLIGEPWPPERVAYFLEAMLDHLAQIHDAGIIHRDIKPENIKQPRDDVYMLLDFGIAKHVTDTHSQRASTRAYAPLEQLGSVHGRTGPRTDLFSLGVTAYELLTGKVPPSSIERNQEDDPLEPPSALIDGVPPALERTLLALLALQPEDRPLDARAALAVLKAPPQARSGTEPLPGDLADGPRRASTFRPLVDRYGKGRIAALATTAEGRSIAVGSTVGIWLYDSQTLADGRFIETDGAITALALVQEGRAMVAAWRGTTRRFALNTGRGLRISAEHEGGEASRAIAPDGQRMAVFGPDGLAVVPLGDQGPALPLAGANEAPQQLGFSPDGALIVAGVGREVLVWQAADGALLWRLQAHHGRVGACGIAPNGQFAAVASGSVVTLYRLSDGRRLHELAGHAARISCLAFSPDAQLLAVAGGPHVRLWRLPEGQPAPSPATQAAPVVGVGFAQSGADLIVATEVSVGAHSVSDGRTTRAAEGHMGRLYGVVWAPDGRLVAAGEATRIWSLHERRLTLMATLDVPADQGGGLAISPDGRMLAIANDTGVTLWSDGKPSRLIDAALAQANALAFTARGDSLVLLTDTAEIHPLDGGEPERLTTISTVGAFDLALSADGSVCAALADQGLQAWRIADAALLLDLGSEALAGLTRERAPISIALSASGGALALVAEGAAYVLDVARPNAPAQSMAATAQYAAFGPDGRTLATVDGGNITIWRAEGAGWRAHHRLTGHTDFVSRLAFHADGQLLASASHDGTLRIWRIEENGQ